MPHSDNGMLYTDGPDQPTPTDDDAAEQNLTDSDDSQTALLPKDFFGDKELKVGGECTVKVERILDNEVQVSYVKEETEDESLEDDEAVEDDEMAGMMTDDYA